MRLNFELEYQKGCDNTVASVLSQVTTCLDLDMAKSILDGVTLGAAHQAEVQDPALRVTIAWSKRYALLSAMC